MPVIKHSLPVVTVTIILWSFTRADTGLLLLADDYQVQESRYLEELGPLRSRCVVACPAQSDAEKYYNVNKSISRTSLFVKAVSTDFKSIEDYVCETTIVPSVIHKKNTDEYEIGYEIYYNESYKESLKPSGNPLLYEPVIDAKTKTKNDETFENLRMGFIWKPIMYVKYDRKALNPIQIYYNRDEVAFIGSDTNTKCNDFVAGKDIFQKGYFDQRYSTENQKQILKSVKIKGEELFVTDSDGNFCESSNGCFVKHQIIPVWYFHLHYTQLASCSEFNTVPIWGIIKKKPLLMLEKYVYAIEKIWSTNIRVISGTSGVVTYLEGQSLYLDATTRRIPIPKWIYKIVEYRLNFDGRDLYFAVIILIRNDPVDYRYNEDGVNFELLCQSACEYYGWEKLSLEDRYDEGVKCCPISEPLLKILNIEYEREFAMDLILSRLTIRMENGFGFEDVRRRIWNIVQQLR